MKVKDFYQFVVKGDIVFYSAHNGKRISKKILKTLQDCEVISVWSDFRFFKDYSGFSTIRPFTACYVSIPNCMELGL